MEEKVLQWHPGFCAALQIELQDEKASLAFYPEYELSKKPMRIDTIIVKKEDDKPVKKNIGRIFRKHNLIEYKSPGDYLSINDFYKVYGYACFYQSDTEKIHEIHMSDITITFVCGHYPREMLRCLKEERGIIAEKTEPGIYRLKNECIQMQIILVHELRETENRWLNSLRTDLKADEHTNWLLEEYQVHRGSKLYQAVMDLIVRANQKTMEEARNMCDALRELFADELEEEVEKVRGKLREEVKEEVKQEVEQEIRKEGIEAFVLDNREEQKTEEQILAKLVKRFSLKEEDAKMYLKQCAKL